MTYTTTEGQGSQPEGSVPFAATWVTRVLKAGCPKPQIFLLESRSLQEISMATKSFCRPSELKVNSQALGALTSGDQLGYFVQDSGWKGALYSIMHSLNEDIHQGVETGEPPPGSGQDATSVPA